MFDRSEHYVYDGEHIVLRYQNGQLANRYVHNPDVVDQVFADENVASLAAPDETHWMATDNQHSVRRIYDYNEATGATVEIDHILYRMFGDVQNYSTMNTTPLFLDTGREWDADVDLYYYRARWYGPAVGKFLSEDPIYDDYNNPHRYVGNSPTNATDPSGLESFTYLWNFPNSNASRPRWKEVQRAEIRSGKTAINGAATAVKSTVSLGLASEPVELVPLTNDERDNPAYAMDVYGYSLCYELAFGMGIGKLASKPGKFRQFAFGWDIAQNFSLIGQGAYNGSPTQIGLGLAGLGGNTFGQFSDCLTTAPNSSGWRAAADAADEFANAPFAPGSVGTAKAWTSIKSWLKAAQLPTSGKIRFVPPKNYNPASPLTRGPGGGYIDRFGNEWVRAPSRTTGEAFDWDVQFSNRGKEMLGWLSLEGNHVNVSLGGHVTH